MTWFALAVLAVWLLVLTLAVAGISRNVAAIEMARRAGPVPVATVNLDERGPAPGALLPEDLVERAHAAGAAAGSLLVFLSPGCGTCLEVADQLSSGAAAGYGDLLFVVVGGTEGESAAELRAVLARSNAPLAFGDDARTLMQGFGVGAVPFAVRLDGQTVTRSRYLRKASDIDTMIERSVVSPERG